MLRDFHHLSALDPGDDPVFDGLDWTTWRLAVDDEHGEPAVVGLTVDV
jgi:hypothetical protein